MIDEKYRKIIDKLIEKSKAKKAIWNKTSRENEFKISLKSSIITTDLWDDEHSQMGLVDLVIRNQRGEVLASLVYNDQDELEDYKYLKLLHDYARESYYRVDDTIDDIFKELDSGGRVGEPESDEDDLPF